MDLRSQTVTQNAYFSLLIHWQLLFVTFYDRTSGNGASFWKHGHTDKKTEPDGLIDLEVEIVIQIN